MMKRAFAIALLGLGITFACHGPASAAAASIPGVIAPLTNTAADAPTPVGFDGCWWDVPIIGAGVAFFELLRDEELDRYCPRHFSGEHYYRRTHLRRHRW
jgi:hypothetical protein